MKTVKDCFIEFTDHINNRSEELFAAIEKSGGDSEYIQSWLELFKLKIKLNQILDSAIKENEGKQ